MYFIVIYISKNTISFWYFHIDHTIACQIIKKLSLIICTPPSGVNIWKRDRRSLGGTIIHPNILKTQYRAAFVISHVTKIGESNSSGPKQMEQETPPHIPPLKQVLYDGILILNFFRRNPSIWNTRENQIHRIERMITEKITSKEARVNGGHII